MTRSNLKASNQLRRRQQKSVQTTRHMNLAELQARSRIFQPTSRSSGDHAAAALRNTLCHPVNHQQVRVGSQRLSGRFAYDNSSA